VQSKRWRDSLLREVIARVIKTILREKMRSQMEQLRHPGLVLYRQCIVEFLNLVFGTSAASLIYWNTEFTEKIQDMYDESLCHEKAEECINIKEHIDLPALFACVIRLTGMIFTPPCVSGDPKFFERANPFQETDLLSFPPKIKPMRIAAYASGTALYLRAKYNTDPAESERIANLASVRFEAALRSNPDDDMILCSYALLLRFQKRYDQAAAYYKMAIHSNPGSARIMSHYAWFLYRDMHLYDKADKYYLKALQADPKHSRTLADYATFLYRVRNDNAKAEEYYLKGLAVGDKQAISGYSTFLAQTGRAEEAKIIGARLQGASGALILDSQELPHQ
jgi:Tfp pilus assembly protein PilF